MQHHNKWWFVLGHEPTLSAAEIFSVLLNRPNEASTSEFYYSPKILTLKADLSPGELIFKLGGTIKIGEEIGSSLSEGQLMEIIYNELTKIEGKINFGISFYSDNEKWKVKEWGKIIKTKLKETGVGVRYVYKNEPVLSSVTVEKNDLLKSGKEFLVKKENDSFSIAKTMAVQPFESFSQRDYGRPGRDSVSGMLPPKLAMMMINLAKADSNSTLLDPFCGSGTILSEAALLGYTKLLGSDISQKAIDDTTKNLNWLKDSSQRIHLSSKLYLASAENLSSFFEHGSVNAVVTEPYMGKPRTGKENEKELLKSAEELSKLYFNVFKDLKKILHPEGRIIFIIPKFVQTGKWISISDKLILLLGKEGFEFENLLPPTINKSPYVLYKRPGQMVAREIWRFKLSSK